MKHGHDIISHIYLSAKSIWCCDFGTNTPIIVTPAVILAAALIVLYGDLRGVTMKASARVTTRVTARVTTRVRESHRESHYIRLRELLRELLQGLLQELL